MIRPDGRDRSGGYGALSPSAEKNSKNFLDTAEFVVNLVVRDLGYQMSKTSDTLSEAENEFEYAGVERADS